MSRLLCYLPIVASVSVLLPAVHALAAAAGPFSDVQVCKAAIATMMGRDPSIMRATTVGTEVRVSYVRDGTTWKLKCRLEGSRVHWGSDPGRWRTHPDDGRVLFSVGGAPPRLRVEERHPDGSATVKSFTTRQLRP